MRWPCWFSQQPSPDVSNYNVFFKWQTLKCISCCWLCDRELETLATQLLRKATLTFIPTTNQVNDQGSRIWTGDGVALVPHCSVNSGFVTWFRFLKVPPVPAQGTTIVPETSVPLSVATCCCQKCSQVWQRATWGRGDANRGRSSGGDVFCEVWWWTHRAKNATGPQNSCG